MTSELLALVVGTILAVGALAFVLHPLFFDVPRRAKVRRPANDDSPDDSAIRALREIEFDRATGKLSDSDYAELRRDYGNRAVSEMRASASSASAPQPAANVDPVEAKVRAWRESHRECRTCGVRPETDAIYCSTCGSYLDGRCGSCGSEIVESSAGFCSTCGAGLGAVV
jgi:hypothetical protein